MIDMLRLYQDYSIPTWTEGNNCQPGWVNTQCCWCDDPSNHLGYCIDEDYYHCWRCGKHFTDDTISKLLGVPQIEARKIIQQYSDSYIKKHKPKRKPRIKSFKMPSGTDIMTMRHRKYLISRNFDPEKLEQEWGLLGTGPVSLLDGRDYKHRIIAPIYWDNKEVSFQGRDITNKSELRYKTCPEDRELIHHKNILYGKQKYWGESGICVEGITDVWRMGGHSFATFGIEFTRKQVCLISKTFKTVHVLYDNQPQAKKQADKLIRELQFRGVEAFRYDIADDPANLSQEEANYIVKQLI